LTYSSRFAGCACCTRWEIPFLKACARHPARARVSKRSEHTKPRTMSSCLFLPEPSCLLLSAWMRPGSKVRCGELGCGAVLDLSTVLFAHPMHPPLSSHKLTDKWRTLLYDHISCPHARPTAANPLLCVCAHTHNPDHPHPPGKHSGSMYPGFLTRIIAPPKWIAWLIACAQACTLARPA
jgi:hypothetical protein